jgi:hypothetical protein
VEGRGGWDRCGRRRHDSKLPPRVFSICMNRRGWSSDLQGLSPSVLSLRPRAESDILAWKEFQNIHYQGDGQIG